MTRDAGAFLRALWKLEAQLIAAGLPAMPAWWRQEIDRFYRSGKRRWVVRKGRRVYASTCVAPRLAVAEMLYGHHLHVPGTPPLVYAFLSVRRDEAANRLRGVRAILDIARIEYDERGDSIELRAYPAIFSVLTASFKTSVGDTVAFCWADEVSRWSDGGANPADEVIGTIAPAMATLPDAKLFLVSSPLGTDDFHARQFDAGETPLQCVSFGATWEINPTMTEAQCRLEEPDTRKFLREYAARPQVGSELVFPYEIVAPAFEPRASGSVADKYFMVLDPSSGGASSNDRFTWGVGAWFTNEDGKYIRRKDGSFVHGPHNGKFLNPDWKPVPPYLRFVEIDGLAGGFFGKVTGDEIALRISRTANRYKIRSVYSDQREQFFLSSALKKHSLNLQPYPWTSASKPQAVEIVRRWLAERLLVLPPHDTLKQELLAFEEKIAPSGQLTYGARRGGHDDYVALLITAAHAELAGELPKSPMRTQTPYGYAMPQIAL